MSIYESEAEQTTNGIILSLLRSDQTAEESSRARECCNWLMEHSSQIKRLIGEYGNQGELISLIYRYYWQSLNKANDFQERKKGTTHTLESLRAYISDKLSKPGLLQLLDELEDHSEPIPQTPDDLDLALTSLETQSGSARLAYILSLAKQALNGTAKHGKTEYTGLEGSRLLLMEALQNGLLNAEPVIDQGKVINDDPDALYRQYIAEDGQSPTIMTGFDELDRHIQMRRGHFVGVLGYNKHRKSTLCRSMAYHMATQQGLNVLWIAAESSYQEELAAYQLMLLHSLNPGSSVTLNRINRHELNERELTQLKEAGDALTRMPGKIKVLDASGWTWEDVKLRVQTEMITTTYDVLVIDYLTFLSTKQKDERSAREQSIRECKHLAKIHNILVMTPIQGNRKGAEAVEEKLNNLEDGVWDREGIDTYSEFSKSCDTIFSIWCDEMCKENKKAIIGVVLCRRSDEIKAFDAQTDNKSGLIWTRKPVIDWEVRCDDAAL